MKTVATKASETETYTRIAIMFFRILVSVLGFISCLCLDADEPVRTPRILFVVGPSGHPPGTHEVAAGARLLKYCVDQAKEGSMFQTVIHEGWPTDSETLAQTRVVVFSGDQFPPVRFKNSTEIFAQLERMVERGCGIVCVHYATSVNDSKIQEVSPAVQSSLYRWLGGFGHFLPGNAKPGTQAQVLPATFTPTRTGHPVVRGVAAFSMLDEPYFPIKFDASASGANVTPLATAMLPPESPSQETVAWCIERGSGSRGVGIAMGHFFKNWQNDDFRKLVLNGIFWAAGVEIPAKGIESKLPPLETFQPASVEYTEATRK